VTPYSSLAAFLAHYRALESSHNLSPNERSLLAEMENLIDSTGPEARALLDSDWANDAAGARRRERTERALRRALLERGALTG